MAKKKRAGGGRTDMVASGNPDVIKEAKGEESYVKKGGRVKKKRDGGPVAHKMTGGAVRPRLDRPGRKRGGSVGADKSPLTGAHNEVSAESTPNPNADSN